MERYVLLIFCSWARGELVDELTADIQRRYGSK